MLLMFPGICLIYLAQVLCFVLRYAVLSDIIYHLQIPFEAVKIASLQATISSPAINFHFCFMAVQIYLHNLRNVAYLVQHMNVTASVKEICQMTSQHIGYFIFI